MKNNANTKYRLYAFSHSWLSGVQKGIQTTHAVTNLLRGGYKNRRDVKQWADEDMTLIQLDGGNCRRLDEIQDLILDTTNFSSSCFYEDEESLNGAMTSVVVVLPDWFYECTLEDYKYKLPQTLWNFFEVVKTAKLSS